MSRDGVKICDFLVTSDAGHLLIRFSPLRFPLLPSAFHVFCPLFYAVVNISVPIYMNSLLVLSPFSLARTEWLLMVSFDDKKFFPI